VELNDLKEKEKYYKKESNETRSHLNQLRDKLKDLDYKLRGAKSERQENEREKKSKETLENMRRL